MQSTATNWPVCVCLSESLCPDLQELECAVSASQQEASSKHSRLEGEITDLKALVEAEVNKARQAEEQHKAAQADQADQLDIASSVTHQLESSQAELLSQVCVMYLSHVCILPSSQSLLLVLCFMTQSACLPSCIPSCLRALHT